jgi:hypothetical protein
MLRDIHPNMKSVKIKLLKNYLVYSLGLGFAFALVHFLLTVSIDEPPPSAGFYSVYIWIASVLSCIIYHWRCVGKIKMKNSAGHLIPVLFIFGSVIACFGIINSINDFGQKIVELETVDLISNVNAIYFKIQRFEPEMSRAMDKWEYRYTTSRSSGVSTFVEEYNAIVPLALNAPNSDVSIWVELSYFEEHKPENDDEKRLLREGGLLKGRQWLKGSSFNEITYFERSAQKAYDILKTNNYPVDNKTIILTPRYNSFIWFQYKEMLMFIGFYLLASALFFGIVWGGVD